MQSFCDYVGDKKNILWHTAKKFAKPDHFMSFTEAKWASVNENTPDGIVLFPIEKTMDQWHGDDPKLFSLYGEAQNTLYIIKAQPAFTESYSDENFLQDIERLRETYKEKFAPNEKLLENYIEKARTSTAELKPYYQNLINKEQNKFDTILEEAISNKKTPSSKLWSVTKWLAANGKNPNEMFTGNAPQRWTNIFRNLDYDGFAFENIAIFFNTNALEVLYEIHC